MGECPGGIMKILIEPSIVDFTFQHLVKVKVFLGFFQTVKFVSVGTQICDIIVQLNDRPVCVLRFL